MATKEGKGKSQVYYIKPDTVWDVWCDHPDYDEPLHVFRYSGSRAKEYAQADADRQNEREGNTTPALVQTTLTNGNGTSEGT